MAEAAPSQIVWQIIQDIENGAEGEMFVHPEEFEKRISDVKFCLSTNYHRELLECRWIWMLVPHFGFLQFLAERGICALHVAKESASRRQLENQGLQNEEMHDAMDHLTFSMGLQCFEIQFYLLYILPIMFLHDKLEGSLYDTDILDSFELEFFGESLDVAVNILQTRSVLRLMEKEPVCISGRVEWYRLWTCLCVHQDWKHLAWGLLAVLCHYSVSLQYRWGFAGFFQVFLLASFGAALYHFTQVPQEERIGVECVVYLFVGMEYADMLINYDLLLIIGELQWGSPFPYWFVLSGAGGIAVLGSFANFFYANPSVVLSYLIHGFCVSLPFIPRLDKLHPGFFGNRPTKWWTQFTGRAKLICFSTAMMSMIIFMRSLLNSGYCSKY